MITVAVVGCGQWGMNHIRNLSALPEVSVKWCCDVSTERLQMMQQQYPGILVTPHLEVLLNEPSIDGVIVATPTATHYAVVKAALEQGKDVLCEKPMTRSVAECEDLIRLAAQRQHLLMVGHVFVFNPAIQKLYTYISSGTLGRLYYLSARRTNLGPIRSDVDAVWDLASHDLSIFDYLLDGRLPVRISASGGAFLSPQRADVAFISLEYPQHIVAHIHVSWLDPQKRREITVVGSDKMAIFNDVALEAPLWLYDKGVRTMEPSLYTTYEQFRALPWERDSIVPHLPKIEPLFSEVSHFVECIQQRRPPRTDGQSGLRVIRTLEALSASMRSNGAPVIVAHATP